MHVLSRTATVALNTEVCRRGLQVKIEAALSVLWFDQPGQRAELRNMRLRIRSGQRRSQPAAFAHRSADAIAFARSITCTGEATTAGIIAADIIAADIVAAASCRPGAAACSISCTGRTYSSLRRRRAVVHAAAQGRRDWRR